MLAPVYSLLLNMDITWLFKIVYPFLFSLMPLALFRIFRLQIKPQYAFLAVAFFITMPMFTMDMTQLVRQQVSELFFVLVILLMVDRRLTMTREPSGHYFWLWRGRVLLRAGDWLHYRLPGHWRPGAPFHQEPVWSGNMAAADRQIKLFAC